MTALFGVRRVLDLEHTFLYLCMRDGGLLDLGDLCSNPSWSSAPPRRITSTCSRPATHLIYKLAPFGYGKDVLRARFKIYLADAAMPSAVLLKGKAILDEPTALGQAAEDRGVQASVCPVLRAVCGPTGVAAGITRWISWPVGR
jgi:hypothetical protein